MFKGLFPQDDFDSVYDIDFEKLRADGIKAALFDIDNTLVPHGAPATDEIIAFFDKLHNLGIQTCLISNNKEPRVKPFADKVNSPYIYKAGKPSGKGYTKAMELLSSDTGNTVFVGDQIFTDIWGARKAGITSYLVKPIHPKEEIQIVLKRRLEWFVLLFYRMEKKHAGRS